MRRPGAAVLAFALALLLALAVGGARSAGAERREGDPVPKEPSAFDAATADADIAEEEIGEEFGYGAKKKGDGDAAGKATPFGDESQMPCVGSGCRNKLWTETLVNVGPRWDHKQKVPPPTRIPMPEELMKRMEELKYKGRLVEEGRVKRKQEQDDSAENAVDERDWESEELAGKERDLAKDIIKYHKENKKLMGFVRKNRAVEEKRKKVNKAMLMRRMLMEEQKEKGATMSRTTAQLRDVAAKREKFVREKEAIVKASDDEAEKKAGVKAKRLQEARAKTFALSEGAAKKAVRDTDHHNKVKNSRLRQEAKLLAEKMQGDLVDREHKKKKAMARRRAQQRKAREAASKKREIAAKKRKADRDRRKRNREAAGKKRRKGRL